MANYDGELRGIGGWLAFFLVTLGVFTPLNAVVSLATLAADAEVAASYGAQWGRLLVLEWTLVGISVAAAWVAVWQFFHVRRWQTVRFAIGVLWLLALLAVVGEPLGVSLMTGLAFGDVFAGAAGEFVRPLVYSSLWTAYLLKSERVANTYPLADPGDEIVEVFE